MEGFTTILRPEGYAWGKTELTYAVVPAADSPAVDAAFAAWGAVCGLDFARHPTNDGNASDFLLTTVNDSASQAPADAEGYCWFQLDASGRITRVVASIDPEYPDQLFVWLHELGHGIPLQHVSLVNEYLHPDKTVMSYGAGGSTTPLIWDLQAAQSLYGPDQDILGTTGADVLVGGAGADWIQGGQGDDDVRGGPERDILRGGQGNDTLKGGLGDDTLYGGLGADVFELSAGADVVMDFGNGADAVGGSILAVVETSEGTLLTGVNGTMLLADYWGWA